MATHTKNAKSAATAWHKVTSGSLGIGPSLAQARGAGSRHA